MVKIPVPETEISTIQLNDTVHITIPAINGKPVEGYIREKGVKAHPLSHTYEVRCEVNNQAKELFPGMVCRARLRTTGDIVMEIPNKCVQTANDGRKYVWVVSGNIVSKREIETESLTEDGVVVRKGLQSGEEVVSGGFQKVVTGSKVYVK